MSSWFLPDDVRMKLQLAGDYATLVKADNPIAFWRLGDREGYAQAVLSDAPTAYWRLGEASGLSLADSSGNGHTITLPNATGYTYHAAGALADGTFGLANDGSATTYGTITPIASGTTCAFEFWAKLSVKTLGVVFHTIVGQDNSNGIWLEDVGDQSGFKVSFWWGGAVHRSATKLLYGTMYHVVVSIAAGAGTFYINGAADGTFTSFTGWSATRFFADTVVPNDTLQGTVDEIVMYANALSAQQIANHYALRTSPIATVAAATVADSSGNGHTGTIAGGVTLAQTAQQPDTDTAARLDGVSGQATAAVPAPGAAFTFEAWFQTTATQEQHLVEVSPAFFYIQNNPYVLKFDGGAGTRLSSVAAVNDGLWHHAVVTYDGTTGRLYLDGVQVDSGAKTWALTGVTAYMGRYFGVPTATFFNGWLDELVLYGYALTAAQVLNHYLAGFWTDVTGDLTDEDTVLTYGIPSSRPEDRCAPAGSCTFGLRNGTNNAGATVGYYSPYSAAKRVGFGFGIRVQLGITLSGVTNYWLGRLRGIVVQSDPFDDPVVHCAAFDWMDDAANQNAQVTLQQNARGDQAFAALITAVPMAPVRTSIDVGSDTYAYAFDNIWNQAKVMAAQADLARSELGYIGQKRDTIAGQTVFYESRHYRPTVTALRVTLNKSMTGLDIVGKAIDILNHVRVTVHPRRANTGASTIVAQQDAAGLSAILPGQAQTFFLNFTDPVQRDTFIGAKNVVVPLVATTDYTMNTASDGSGTDLTASFTVDATAFASALMVTLTNAGGIPGFVTKLQARGDGVYALNPIVAEAMNDASIAASGDNLADLDLLYQSDPTFAYNFAQYISRLYGTPLANVQAVTFCANESATLLSAAVFGEISEKVALVDTVNGLVSAQPFYINAVTLTISQRNRIDCTWQLAPADTFRYWQLGIAGASELGSTTILAL